MPIPDNHPETSGPTELVFHHPLTALPRFAHPDDCEPKFDKPDNAAEPTNCATATFHKPDTPAPEFSNPELPPPPELKNPEEYSSVRLKKPGPAGMSRTVISIGSSPRLPMTSKSIVCPNSPTVMVSGIVSVGEICA